MRIASLLAPARRPSAIAWMGFVSIAGAISANALFLQGGRHPAPLFETLGSEAADAPAPVRDRLVEAVQEALGEQGFYSGPIDGVAGPQTVAAIKAFEGAAGRLQTGRATAPILAAILAAEFEPTPADEPKPAAEPVEVDPQVAAVQSALSRAAYGQITPDGVMGPRTEDAIRRFQADHGLEETGAISDALMLELRAAGALDGG